MGSLMWLWMWMLCGLEMVVVDVDVVAVMLGILRMIVFCIGDWFLVFG